MRVDNNGVKNLQLKPGREKSVMARHPWVFSGAVQRVDGEPGMGETVLVYNANGQALGLAAYSPQSSIRARMWSLDPEEKIDAGFFKAKIERAIERRAAIIADGETNALRLVHAESDGLPGVVVDRYDRVLVLQLLTAGAETWRETIYEALEEITGLTTIVERSDVDVRQLEGLPPRSGIIRGETPGLVEIRENGLRFLVDVVRGQKTGFYIDQRRNRQRVGELAAGREVLNCFCYSGGFSVYALANGAKSVTSVDSSAEALQLGRENMALNGLPGEKAAWIDGDVFKVLRTMRDQGRSFDMVILDPPKFAPTAAQAERAARGYKDINLLGLKLLRPGGILTTFSCSGGVSMELFQKIVAGAALVAQVAPHVDIWMVQLGNYERWARTGKDDAGNPFSIEDLYSRVGWWVSTIKGANPSAKVWVQAGIGTTEGGKCLAPQPVDEFLAYRARLGAVGVDGLFVMPSQTCQLSTDPADHEAWLQAYEAFQDAVIKSAQ